VINTYQNIVRNVGRPKCVLIFGNIKRYMWTHCTLLFKFIILYILMNIRKLI